MLYAVLLGLRYDRDDQRVNAIKTGNLTKSKSSSTTSTLFTYDSNFGCYIKAFDFINNFGVMHEKNYPCQGYQTRCYFDGEYSYPMVSIDRYERVPSNNMITWRKAVSAQTITMVSEQRGAMPPLTPPFFCSRTVFL